MKVTVAAVVSLDGKMTKHGQPNIYDWVSREDQAHFEKLRNDHDAIVMGSGTYKTIRGRLRLSPDKLRVVLTHRPKDFAKDTVFNQLEFMAKNPEEFVYHLESRGCKKLLVAGGSQMITDFLKAELVDEFYLTIEPLIFGYGTPLLVHEELDIKLKLLSQKTLNSQGTLLLIYKIIR